MACTVILLHGVCVALLWLSKHETVFVCVLYSMMSCCALGTFSVGRERQKHMPLSPECDTCRQNECDVHHRFQSPSTYCISPPLCEGRGDTEKQ